MAKSFLAFAISAFMAVAAAFSSFAAAVGGLVVEVIELAFPAASPPLQLMPVAAAPRVTGLHESRSFRGRIAERWQDGRSRAPLSTAFVGT